ncbi:glycosyltransferase [Rhodobacterales bacterium HKCCE2091]|nr:glycosyltransferase [Rhodobacterales bacterium HKCCE2091]
MTSGGEAASVIVASHGRPALFRRACLSVWQQDHRPLELVVVACNAGLAAISDLPFADRIKTVEQVQPNLSAARNAGIALAGGDVCAFLDDDAAAEPGWLSALVAALADADAVTGPVIGRNGFSVQWGDTAVTGATAERAITAGEGPGPGEVRKLLGTNMAVRSDVLAEIGGFDEGFRYYLDDTDLSLRLAGRPVAFAPDARVHHAFAESPRRDAARRPLDLTEIAASQVLFLRKHCPGPLQKSALAEFRHLHVQRIGAAPPGRRDGLLRSLDDGLREGGTRESRRPDLGLSNEFRALRKDPPRAIARFHGRWFQKSSRLVAARQVAADGHPAALVLLDPTARPHRIVYRSDGIWMQLGGLFGRSQRDEPRIRLHSYNRRVAAELSRFGPTRDKS